MNGLLSIIAKVKKERRSKNLEDLTAAELSMKIAGYVSDDPDEQRLIAAAIAIRPHSKVEPILEELEEIGVFIRPERVMELQRDPIFLRLHRPRTCMDDTYAIEHTYAIEQLKEYSALAITAAAAVRMAEADSG